MAALAGISPDEAFEILRKRARSNRQRLAEVALAVLDGHDQLDDLREGE